MPDQAAIEEALRKWSDGPDRLDEALAGLAEEDLDRTPPGSGWSIRQIVTLTAIPDAWGRYLVQVDLPDWAEVKLDEPRITVEDYITGLAGHVSEHITEIHTIRQWIESQKSETERR